MNVNTFYNLSPIWIVAFPPRIFILVWVYNTFTKLTFTLSKDYLSPFDLSQSTEFKEWVGTIGNILPVYSPIPATLTSCDGGTLTDYFNCDVPTNQVSGWEKRASGIDAIDEPIKIIISRKRRFQDRQFWC